MTQDNTPSFDLEANDTTSETAIRVVAAVDADGNDVCGFFVVGKNSAAYQKESQRIRAVALRRASNRKSLSDTSTEAGSVALAKTIDDNELTLATAITVDWFGFARNKMPIAFDRSAASGLLAKYPTWREKIIAAVEADANFIKT
jgi:hypothetical protein